MKIKGKTFVFNLTSVRTFRLHDNMPTEGKIAFSMPSDCPQILTVSTLNRLLANWMGWAHFKPSFLDTVELRVLFSCSMTTPYSHGKDGCDVGSSMVTAEVHYLLSFRENIFNVFKQANIKYGKGWWINMPKRHLGKCCFHTCFKRH